MDDQPLVSVITPVKNLVENDKIDDFNLLLSLLELLMDLAVAIGAVALVTWGYMVIVKELIVTNRIVMAYIAFIPLIGVYACILYFLWKATKNIRSKLLDY